MRKLFTLLWLLAGTGAWAQPTDNPVEVRYPGQYPWTSNLAWSNVFSIATYGGVGDSLTDNVAAFQAAVNAAHAAGGGVVYFPAGVYYFSKDIMLKHGVVLRGETPAFLDAQDPNYRLASRLVFPKYEPSRQGNGTPDSTAFKLIYSENPNTDGNLGLVYLDINRATIYLANRFGSAGYLVANQYVQTNENVVILGIRNNNAAVTGSSRATTPGLGSNVPQGSQWGWQRWPNRFVANLNVEVFANCLVASSRFNDDITDDFIQTGYKYRDGSVVTDSNSTWFRYSDKSAVFVNIQMPDATYWAADSAKAPWWFRPGIVVRDNWIYRTKRDGIQASGNGLLVMNNIVQDNPDKPCALNPTGLTPAQGYDYNGNRSIWIRGGNNVVVEGNRVVGHQQRIGQYASNDGEGIVADNQGSIINGLLVRDNDITCNWAGVYDVPRLLNILFVGNHVRRNNFNSTQDLLIWTKLPGYEGQNWCKTCIVDSNFIYGNGPGGQIFWTIEAGSQYWVTRNKYLTNAGAPNTGGIVQVQSRELGAPRNLDTASVYEGCNDGFSRGPGPVRWWTPPTCQEVPTDSVIALITSSLIPTSFARASQWTVYPNPSNGRINLGFAQQHAGLTHVQVLSLQGQTLTGWTYDPAHRQINAEGLPVGTYLITGIDRNGNRLSARFVKM